MLLGFAASNTSKGEFSLLQSLDTSPTPPSAPALRDGGHSLELPVEVGEQLVATGDRDRLGDKVGSGIGIPVAQAQGQEAAEVSVESTRRAVTDPAESNAQ